MNTCQLRNRLSHILWIGGPPDSGKTSAARLLGEKYELPVYHFDRHELVHFTRADPERHPALYAAHPDRMTAEERWLGSPPGEMAETTIECWSERFTMAVDDLLAMPDGSPAIVEGPGLFPDCVYPVIADRRQAIWLVPTDTFKRGIALERGKPGNRDETSDPERATENLIQRDLLMGRHIRQRVAALGLTLIEVDGAEPVEQIAARVEDHFGPHLTSR